MKPQDRERIQIEVTQRVVGRYLDEAKSQSAGALTQIIHDTLYHEAERLKRASPHDKDAKRDRAHYQRIRRQLSTASSADLPQILQLLARRFVAEIVGNFDQRVYQLSTHLVPRGLSLLLGATSPFRLLTGQKQHRPLTDHIRVEGALAPLQALAQRGTLMVVPTHSSHLDSLIMAWAIYSIGLPPHLYGAGLNLFTNPVLSFFMRNLGAYRIDRKKKSRLYKDLVKEYATCAAEYGYHQLFFPGGTRSRSGAVEQQLKKGLLGTALHAYIQNLKQGSSRPDIYVVPCTISCNLVLEAETLIADHLQETGHSQYIIEDDESSRPRRIWNFLRGLIAFADEIIVTFGQPLDVVGNLVDQEGTSRDPRQRPVSTASYVLRDGVPVIDAQRDMEYTDELARAVGESYLRDNVIRPTHLVGRALVRLLRRENPELGLYRLLHTGGRHASWARSAVEQELARLLAEIHGLKLKPRLDPLLSTGNAAAILDEALKRYAIYHTRPAAVGRGDRIYHEDRNLLLYYGNRLENYGLGSEASDG